MNRQIGKIATATAFLISVPAFAGTIFQTGNLVVSVEGCGIESGPGVGCAGVTGGTGNVDGYTGNYGDNQAAPLSLFQFTTSGTYVNSLVLPQTANGANLAVSGEYGSSSEATLQLSGNGLYLTIMGYGINAQTFNTNSNAYSATPNAALAQSGSLTNQSTYTPVARVATLIDSNGNVNSTTGLFNIFDNNNPRSAYTANGATVYVSGQGNSDATGGVFTARLARSTIAPHRLPAPMREAETPRTPVTFRSSTASSMSPLTARRVLLIVPTSAPLVQGPRPRPA